MSIFSPATRTIYSLALLGVFALALLPTVTHAAVSTFADGIVIGDTTLSGTLSLDVAGLIGATQYCDQAGSNCVAATDLGGGVWTESGSNIYYTTGNVGIGTTTPSYDLSVVGDVSISGLLYDASSSSGTQGMVLQRGSSGLEWVATSTLESVSGSSVAGNAVGDMKYYDGSEWLLLPAPSGEGDEFIFCNNTPTWGGCAPTVTTTNVTSITSSSADSGGNVTSNNGASVSARGIAYSTSPTPDINDSTVSSGAGTGVFSSSMSGLSGGTTYYVRAFATNSAGTAYGSQESFTTSVAAPTVTIGSITDITTTQAETTGNVTSDGGASVTARGIAYDTTTSPTTADSTVSSGSGTGSFPATISGLSAGTTYYARAYATNSAGTGYSSQTSFTTSVDPPTVSTYDVTNISGSSATGNGEVTSDGGASVSARGFAYDTTTSPTTADSTVSAGSGTGTFNASITGLSNGTTYYVRAYATNSAGTSYGVQKSFTTPTVPTVQTYSPYNITNESATGNGNISSNGGASISNRGFAYATTPDPDLNDSVAYSMESGVGEYTANLTGLSASTQYHIRAFATNSVGTGWGSDYTFNTSAPPPPGNVVSTETISYAGHDQGITVPSGVSYMTVKLWGAGGRSSSWGDGGGGGYAEVKNVPVTSGSTVTVKVGGTGTVGQGQPGGWPDGGTAGYRDTYVPASGGGRSEVEYNSEIIAIAGAGGGGGSCGDSNGGGGGGTTGAAGYGRDPYGGGGTQSAGGSGPSPSMDGSYNQGGAGGNSMGSGGGGGGYYGGAGSESCGSAGGGSGYINPSYEGTQVSAGQSTTAANTMESEYPGSVGNASQNGAVVIIWRE